MRDKSMRWFSVLMGCAGLFLITGTASADRYKNESKKGKDKYEREYYDERYDSYGYEEYRGQSSYGHSNSAWSVGGSWEGARGGVDVHVYGGSHRYPRHDDYDRGRRHYRHRHIPAGHLPPPGECRVWLHDRPAGHQPPPTSCRRAEHYAYRHGGEVIYGGPRR